VFVNRAAVNFMSPAKKYIKNANFVLNVMIVSGISKNAHIALQFIPAIFYFLTTLDRFSVWCLNPGSA
jgi:hypothetical protein